MSGTAELTFIQSPYPVRVGEVLPLRFDAAPFGATTEAPPASVTMLVTNAAGTDVTATVASGSVSVSGTVATLKALTFATAGKYRLVVTFTTGGKTFKPDVYLNVVG